MAIKVLIVDDSALMRSLLSEVINSAPDLEVVEELVAQVRQARAGGWHEVLCRTGALRQWHRGGVRGALRLRPLVAFPHQLAKPTRHVG